MYNANFRDNIDNKECEKKIKLRLSDIQNLFDFGNFDLAFYNRKIKTKCISLYHAQERSDIYKNIAKLGLYIINDYDFFFKLIIQSAFNTDLYNTAMQNLGYQRNGSSWKLIMKPSQDVVIDYIYKYCYYSYIVSQKEDQKIDLLTKKDCCQSNNEIIFRATICGEGDKNYVNQRTQNDINAAYDKTYKTLDDGVCHWTCAHCEFRNADQNLQNCAICEKSRLNLNQTDKAKEEENENNNRAEKAPKIEDKWICTTCTFVNEKSNKICQTCSKPKNSIGENLDYLTGLDIPDETWLCKSCSLNNSYEYYKCKNCKSSAPFFNKWKCEKCSFINKKYEKQCKTCGTNNPNLIDCLECKKQKIHRQYDELCDQCFAKNEVSFQYFKRSVSLDGLKSASQYNVKYRHKELTNVKYVDKMFNKYEDYSSTVNVSKDETKEISANDVDNVQRKQGNFRQSSIANYEPISKISFFFKRLFGIANKTVCEKEKLNDKLDINSNNINQKETNQNLKICKHCKTLLKDNEIHWCMKCEIERWFCSNEACGRINFRKANLEYQFCDKCKAKKGSDFSNCKSFEIFDKDRITVVWQCGYCWQFSCSTSNKCTNNNCGNLRMRNNCLVCSCNWVNFGIQERCQKCGILLWKN